MNQAVSRGYHSVPFAVRKWELMAFWKGWSWSVMQSRLINHGYGRLMVVNSVLSMVDCNVAMTNGYQWLIMFNGFDLLIHGSWKVVHHDESTIGMNNRGYWWFNHLMVINCYQWLIIHESWLLHLDDAYSTDSLQRHWPPCLTAGWWWVGVGVVPLLMGWLMMANHGKYVVNSG